VKNTKARYVTKILLDLLYLFGTPTQVTIDRGTAFTPSVLKSSATPRANGQCERYKGTIVNALAGTSAGSAEDEWDTFVKQVQSALNCTYNKSIAVSSLEALAGYKPRHVANSNILSAVQDDLSRMDLAELRSKIHQRIAKDQKAQKERFDKTRAATTKYVKGQLVMVSNAVSSTGTSKKLLPKFKGPLRVRTVLPNDRYEVEDPREGRTNPFTKGTDGCTYYRSFVTRFCVVAFLFFFF
jgi:hypothetical protein